MSRSKSSLSTKRFNSPVVTRLDAELKASRIMPDKSNYTGPGLRRNKRDLRIIQELQRIAHVLDKSALVFFRADVPLVYAQHYSPALFMRIAGDGSVQPD